MALMGGATCAFSQSAAGNTHDNTMAMQLGLGEFQVKTVRRSPFVARPSLISQRFDVGVVSKRDKAVRRPIDDVESHETRRKQSTGPTVDPAGRLLALAVSRHWPSGGCQRPKATAQHKGRAAGGARWASGGRHPGRRDTRMFCR